MATLAELRALRETVGRMTPGPWAHGIDASGWDAVVSAPDNPDPHGRTDVLTLHRTREPQPRYYFECEHVDGPGLIALRNAAPAILDALIERMEREEARDGK